MNRLAKKIKDARLAAKLTERQLADKCGLKASYIIQIESGKKIVREEIAETILKALGDKRPEIVQEAPKEMLIDKKREEKPQGTVPIKPNDQWASALAGVIKSYPVYDFDMQKARGQRDMVIKDKKVFGHHPDRIAFIQADKEGYPFKRIQSGDEIALFLREDVVNDQLYYLKHKGIPRLRILRKEGNKMVSMRSGALGDRTMKVPMSDIKIIGQCIEVKFKV